MVEATFIVEKEKTPPFADIPEDFWAVKEITWTHGKGYMNGVSAERFALGRTGWKNECHSVLILIS